MDKTKLTTNAPDWKLRARNAKLRAQLDYTRCICACHMPAMVSLLFLLWFAIPLRFNVRSIPRSRRHATFAT